jgi:hypothetical protein
VFDLFCRLRVLHADLSREKRREKRKRERERAIFMSKVETRMGKSERDREGVRIHFSLENGRCSSEHSSRPAGTLPPSVHWPNASDRVSGGGEIQRSLPLLSLSLSLSLPLSLSLSLSLSFFLLHNCFLSPKQISGVVRMRNWRSFAFFVEREIGRWRVASNLKNVSQLAAWGLALLSSFLQHTCGWHCRQ